MSVFEQRSTVSTVLSFLQTVQAILLILASQSSSQSFPREIREILLFDGKIWAVLLDVGIARRFGIIPALLAFMIVPSVRKMGSRLGKGRACSNGALT